VARPVVDVVARPVAPETDSAGIPWDYAGVIDLGTDWTAVRTFAQCAAAVILAGPVVGNWFAGPVGVVAGSGSVALGLFVGAHVRFGVRR
jgi:hypothetical protein